MRSKRGGWNLYPEARLHVLFVGLLGGAIGLLALIDRDVAELSPWPPGPRRAFLATVGLTSWGGLAVALR
eukprot:1276180-Alexandrium_andersonii.AAC.1